MKRFIEASSYRQRLVGELVQRQRKNPSYSLRSFARDLRISPATLSQALNAKRNLSKSSLLKVAEKLSFSPSETSRALDEISGASGPIADDQYTLLQDDVFRYMSDWYYFAILCLAEVEKAKADPEWLAARFGITALEAKDALDRLLRLGLIEIKQGMVLHDGAPLRTTDHFPSSAVRMLQKHHLRLAEKSLETDPIDLRDMTSMTMATKRSRLPQAKEMIKTFRRKLARFLEAEGGDEVYVLALQLFPVTKSDGDPR